MVVVGDEVAADAAAVGEARGAGDLTHPAGADLARGADAAAAPAVVVVGLEVAADAFAVGGAGPAGDGAGPARADLARGAGGAA
ncbi:MAG: hypothetical protein ACK55I_15965, partial [bacterium]